MAKKKSKPSTPAANDSARPEHGAKSAAIRDYLVASPGARPKEIVEALKAKGIVVSPNMVSIVKAKAGIKKARRSANAAVANNDTTARAQTDRSNGLEAALLLYKAARGQDVAQKQVTSAFLSLVELLS